MSDKTHIEWTDATWNPITGCSVVSPGCTNCYAMKLAGTRLRDHPSRAGLTQPSKAGPVWTGEVRFNPHWLCQPLNWRKPRMIFVCAHADLFHPDVPDAWIDQIFAVMALTPHHTYQVLTKRADRMRSYMEGMSTRAHERLFDTQMFDVMNEKGIPWPLKNVWLGVSVEDQARADQRIPDLLATPAAIRWISAEPLLGPIDLTALALPETWAKCECTDFPTTLNVLDPSVYCEGCCEGAESVDSPGLDWVVVGGESGPNARPMQPDWVRAIRDQCDDTDVPFFFKQWGSWLPPGQRMSDGQLWNPHSENFLHTTKSLSGDLLDGIQHHNFPTTQDIY